MKPPHQHHRINLAELKSEIVKKLGPEGSKQYFYYLSRFLNLKLSKDEFNKLCFRIIGRDNIPLHNQFVHSILGNVCNAKVPPPKQALKSVLKQTEPNQLVLSNGDHKLLSNSNSNIKLENGHLSTRQVHHQQVLTNATQNEGQVPHHRCHASVSKSLQDEAIRKTMPLSYSGFCGASSFSIGGLLDSSALRERMEKIVLMQGLKGVTIDCAGLLNKGLDTYLKGLISSGVDLVGSRLGSEPTQSYTNKHQVNVKHINGVNYGHNHQHKAGDLPLSVSLLDFKVAMELNPQQLGEDSSLLMEKICTQAFDEE